MPDTTVSRREFARLTGAGLAAALVHRAVPARAAGGPIVLDSNENPATDGCCGITDASGFALCQAASACMRSGQLSGAGCNVAGDTFSPASRCHCTGAALCPI